MRRWNIPLKERVVMPAVDKFIEDLLAVYKKHGLSLAYEDIHGAFIVEAYVIDNVDWLRGAQANIIP